MKVGFIWREGNAEALALATHLATRINAECVLGPKAADGLDACVVLGGDGTVLHAVARVGFDGVPILGINLGKFGFLTETNPSGAEDAIAKVLAGKARVEERCTAAAEITRADGSVEALGQAINEASLERAVGGKVIRLAISVGDQHFAELGADGVVIATPTGSTAYSFSMHGPIIASELESLCVVTVGPHSLLDRPLVVGRQPVHVDVKDRGHGVVVLDGVAKTDLREGERLTVRIGPAKVKLLRVTPDSVFTRFAKRFHA